MNLKKLNLTVLLVSILVLVPTIQIVYASSLSTFYLSGGIYPQGDYTLWKDGSNYYAKDVFGSIAYSGSDVDVLINNAISALPSTGGIIHLTKGTFTIDASLVIPSYVSFRGSGISSTTIYNIATDGTHGILINGTDANARWGIKLSDFEIKGNSQSGDGIHGYHMIQYCSIERVRAYQNGGDGFHLEKMWGTEITGCFAIQNYKAGYNLTRLNGTPLINNYAHTNEKQGFILSGNGMSVTGCISEHNKHEGFRIINMTWGFFMTGCYIELNEKTALWIVGASGDEIQRGTIIGNRIASYYYASIYLEHAINIAIIRNEIDCRGNFKHIDIKTTCNKTLIFQNYYTNISLPETAKINDEGVETSYGQIEVYSDATRPSPIQEGMTIYNTDDDMLNVCNGTDWLLPDGTIT